MRGRKAWGERKSILESKSLKCYLLILIPFTAATNSSRGSAAPTRVL